MSQNPGFSNQGITKNLSRIRSKDMLEMANTVGLAPHLHRSTKRDYSRSNLASGLSGSSSK